MGGGATVDLQRACGPFMGGQLVRKNWRKTGEWIPSSAITTLNPKWGVLWRADIVQDHGDRAPTVKRIVCGVHVLIIQPIDNRTDL
jgi:hypothetical protein